MRAVKTPQAVAADEAAKVYVVDQALASLASDVGALLGSISEKNERLVEKPTAHRWLNGQSLFDFFVGGFAGETLCL